MSPTGSWYMGSSDVLRSDSLRFLKTVATSTEHPHVIECPAGLIHPKVRWLQLMGYIKFSAQRTYRSMRGKTSRKNRYVVTRHGYARVARMETAA